MKPSLTRRFALTAPVLALLTALGAGQTGCAREALFNVTRPAQLDASAVGNTMTVGTIAANGHDDAAAQITNDLSSRIANSLNPSIRLLANGGAVQITGSVVADSYSESTETVSATCNRTVDDGVDANGTPQWHMESYDCSYTEVVGSGATSVEFAVTDVAHQTTLSDQVYTATDSVVNPSTARANQLVASLRAKDVSDFARVILPWQDSVRERFETCDGDSRCRVGFDRVRAGALAEGEGLFTSVVGIYDDATLPVPPHQTERVAGALYDRGVTRAYLGQFTRALTDLQRAAEMQPQMTRWQDEIGAVQRLQRDAATLAHETGGTSTG